MVSIKRDLIGMMKSYAAMKQINMNFFISSLNRCLIEKYVWVMYSTIRAKNSHIWYNDRTLIVHLLRKAFDLIENQNEIFDEASYFSNNN